ncbi:MAG: PDZ domain-containing protein [Planctomycetes bacterium]|nr:PDZ domain-containing protein [Planctomycetota bacterium]
MHLSLSLRRPLLLAVAGGLLPACQFGPARPIPDPPPEVLAWAEDPAEGTPGVFLGLEVRENDSGSLDDLFFAPGARVVEVVAGSPAETSGLQVGDILLEVADEEILDGASLAARLQQLGPGPCALEVQRGDAVFKVPVELRALEGQAGAAEAVAVVDPTRTLARWRDAGGGAGLEARHPEGPLARAGVPVGAVVTAVDDAPIRSARALVRTLAAAVPGQRVQLSYRTAQDADARAEVELFEPDEVLLEAGLPLLLSYQHDPGAQRTEWTLLDLWLIWLVRYERDGEEHRWSALRFLRWSTGVGELGVEAGS